MKIKNLAVAVALVAFASPLANAQQIQQKSIVLDERGNVVTTREGVCVTHNWPEDNAVCANQFGNLGIPNIVYFDFDRSSLNKKGQQVVSQVATGLNNLHGNYNVKLSGHADRVASVAYNQRLSERRAATVKSALVAKGVPAGKIATAGYGETKNAVPTKDGVAEQLNRRVEIEVTK